MNPKFTRPVVTVVQRELQVNSSVAYASIHSPCVSSKLVQVAISI